MIDIKDEGDLHERINKREPNSILAEQFHRTPSKLTAVLSQKKEIEKNNKKLEELNQKTGSKLGNLAVSHIKKERMLFREFYEQVEEKYLPLIHQELKKLDASPQVATSTIDVLRKYISNIYTAINESEYWTGCAKTISELSRDLGKTCLTINRSSAPKYNNKEISDSFYQIEFNANNIVNLYTKIENQKSSDWKVIDSLREQNKNHGEIIMRQQNRDKIEYEKGPVVRWMKFLANRFIERNQKVLLNNSFSTRFSDFLKMKFTSFDDLIKYLIDEKNIYRITILADVLGKEVADFPEKNQLMILESIKDISEVNTTLNSFYMGGYVKNVSDRKIARILALHTNRRAREYLLYNDKLSPKFMFDEILPILKKDEDPFIKEKAGELYNTILSR